MFAEIAACRFFKIKLFYNIIYVFTLTFDQFNVSMLISFEEKKSYWPQTFEQKHKDLRQLEYTYSQPKQSACEQKIFASLADDVCLPRVTFDPCRLQWQTQQWNQAPFQAKSIHIQELRQQVL